MPALESIETVNVVTNNFDAEQGLAGGAAISVQIKSGTNQLRGSAFEYHFNEKMRAQELLHAAGHRTREVASTISSAARSADRSGGTSCSIFVSYEGTLDRQATTRYASGADRGAAARRLLRARTTDLRPADRQRQRIRAHSRFQNNQIPLRRISPTAQWFIDRIPLPNLPRADGTMPETNNYFVQAPFLFDRWTLDSKVNWNVTNRLNMFVRYSMLDFSTENDTMFGDELQGPALAGGNPGIGYGQHLQLFGRRHLHGHAERWSSTPTWVGCG